ncbi:MAG: hypothetical protein AABX24_00430, partial [Nanoarchaeota archaeon]
MTNPLDPWKSFIEQLNVFRPGPNSNLPPETRLSLESYLMQNKDDHLLLTQIIEAGKHQKKQGFLRKFNRIASPKQSKIYRLMEKSLKSNRPYGLPSTAEEEYERSCKSIAQETFRQLAGDYGWSNLQGKSLEHALLQEGVPLALFNRLTYCEEDIPTMLSTIRRKVLIETPPERDFDKLQKEYFERFHVYDLNGKDLGEDGRLFVETAYFGQVVVSNSYFNLIVK